MIVISSKKYVESLTLTLLVIAFFLSIFDFYRVFGDGFEFVQSSVKGFVYILIIAFFFIQAKKSFFFIWIRNNKLISMYFVFCILSLLWTFSSGATITGLVSFLSLLCMSYLVYFYVSREALVKALCSVCVFFVISGFVLDYLGGERFYDFLQGVYRFSGLSYGPHALARISGLAVILLLWLIFFSRNSLSFSVCCVVTIFMGISVLVSTDSRQTILALFFSIFLIFYFRFIRGRNNLILLLFLFVFFLIFTCMYHFGALSFLSLDMFARNDISELTTFTGRIFIWEDSILLIKERFFLGYGYNAGGEVLSGFYETGFGWTTKSAHNVLLHAMLDVGMLGAFLLISWLIVLWWLSFLKKDVLLFVIIVYFFIMMYVERIFAGSIGFEIMIVFLLFSSNELVEEK